VNSEDRPAPARPELDARRTAAVVAGLQLRRVFLSYSHDDEGRWLERALRRQLQDHGCDVVSDHDLHDANPSSIQAWMDEQIATRIVLCLLSEDYVQAFAERAEGAPRRAGSRYELRAIRQRIYDHEGASACPVIPVASPGFVAEHAPSTLRALVIARCDAATGEGVDRIAGRIAALTGTSGDGAVSVDRPDRLPGDGRALRRVLHELETTDELSARAVELVRESLELAGALRHPAELLGAFPSVEKVIKAHGDLQLMTATARQCLRVLDSPHDLLQREAGLEAEVRIFAVGWALAREHKLDAALEQTVRGIRLAEQHQDRKTAAYGRIRLGRLRMLVAEQVRGHDQEYHLRAGYEALAEAIERFVALDDNGRTLVAVGACLGLQARIQLARYRLLNEKPALERAAELADRAEDSLLPGTADYFDLVIIQAEIAAARRHWAEAKRWLGQVIQALVPKPGALPAEILGRAHHARADVLRASHGAKAEILHHLRCAREIFEAQELGYEAAACEWTMMVVDSTTVTPLKVTREDTLQLAELTTDPRIRLAAIAELERQDEDRIRNRPSARKVNWEHLVNKVQPRW